MVMTFGSFATEIHEPCQVRNEAALSESFCVPKGRLDRANCTGNVCGQLFEAECAVLCCFLYCFIESPSLPAGALKIKQEGFCVAGGKGSQMSYQALYRKWRPTDFEDVKGQEPIVTTLKNQIRAGRIGHAYLFCGTRGTGKTTVAKIFAKAVNCEHSSDGSPCNACSVCKAIAAGSSMNVIEIDAASNNGVDNIRQIREEVQYSPTEGKYKVYIIDEVHMLSIGAFNALLKTLEEPPPYVIFILATTEAHKIPITILSRCQRYDFHRITIETIADRLTELMKEEGVAVEDKAIRYIAKAADGSMRDALSLLDQCIAFYLGKELKYDNVLEVLGAVDTQVFSRLLKIIWQGDTGSCMELIDRMVMQGRDLSQFVADFVWYLRNLLLVKTTDDASKLEEIMDVSTDNLRQLSEEAKHIDVQTLMRYIRIFSDLTNDLKYAVQKRIKVEVALIKLIQPAMEQSTDLGDVLSRLTVLESRLAKAQEQLENGAAASISLQAAGTDASAKETAAPIEKRVIEALPEDIEQIAKQWDAIVYSIDDMMEQTFLSKAHVTLAKDGKSLEVMLQSTSAYAKFSREADKNKLADLIEERTGVSVNLIVTKLADNDDFQNRFTDIRELVNMDIVVDDKEEFI